MATLTVGTGEQYATIAAAVAASQAGDTVLVNDGTYTNDFFDITHALTLQSVGGMATILATTQPSNGKGAIVVDADATINGFGVTGVTVGDGNGAGIRYDSGNLTVENSAFWTNQNGILANADPTGNIVINNCEFGFNGAGDGYTHNIYINDVNSLLVENSYFHDSQAGHEIKSRASNTTIINNYIEDQQGDGSYDIDLPDGGNDLIEGNIIQKGANAENYFSIHYGGEGTPYANSALTITGNELINDNPNGQLILNQSGLNVSLTGNLIYGYAASAIANGPVTQSGNITLSTQPALYNTTRLPANAAPLPTSGSSGSGVTNSTPAAPADLSLSTPLTTFGPQGAVTASGHILEVGPGKAFTSIGAALAASQDGDTIQVAAGTYVNDFGTVNHKVILEGVGGIARMVEQNQPGATNGILDVNNDVTIENMEFTGSATANGRIPALFINAGNVTLNNVLIDNNEIGLYAANNPNTTLSIFNSEIGPNGNVARGTNNLQVSAIGSLTMVNDYVHGAFSGHEIVSDAFNNDIENTRIIDGANVASSFLVDLGLGGNDTLKNDTLVKDPAAANGVFVHIGGEGTQWANSAVSITGTTFVSQYVNGGHPYTYFIVEDGSSTEIPVTANNDTFVGGVAGSQEFNGNDITGANETVATTATINTTSPVSTAVPGFTPLRTFGSKTVTLALREEPGSVDAAFDVKVDGVAVGGGTVTAQLGSPAQIFTFDGNWSNGAHTVEVDFANPDASAPAGAYALDIASITMGNTSLPVAAHLTTNTSVALSLGDTLSSPDFDPTYYLAQHPAVAAAGADPMQDYFANGAKQGANPDAWFDANYYLTQNPDVAASGMNPLLHYEQYGWKEGRDPSLAFSTKGYENANSDVAAANVDPLGHYLQYGQYEGRTPILQGGSEPANPLVNTSYFDQQLGATIIPTGAAADQQAMWNYDNGGWQKGLNPDAWFNTSYYLAHNPDVAAAHVDPLLHYEQYGWKEGRDPSAQFSTDKYLAAYSDVKAAGVDPLIHFLQYGQAEGRTAFAV